MDGFTSPPSAPDSAARRLLRAARSAFAAHGFEAASTRDIALAAGVQQGLVRHHFGSKAGLFEAVLDAACSELEGDLSRVDPLTVAGWSELLRAHHELARLALHAWLSPGEPAVRARARLEAPWQRLLELQRAALGEVPDAELRLRMWIGSSLAAVLSSAPSDADASRDVLFAWLCAQRAPAQPGPFAIAAAQARLRG